MVKVYLSPSCQEKNAGFGGYNEEVAMNKLCDKLQAQLKRMGIDTERNNPNDQLGHVVQKANAYGPMLHVALHSNAYNKKARGLEIWTNNAGTEAAKKVYDKLNVIIPGPNRGIKAGDKLYETSHTKHPTILIEYDFHDTEAGATLILGQMDQLAEATARGIAEYLGVDYEPVKPHWAEAAYMSLQGKGLKINEKRFDDKITRGEVFALLDRIMK